MVVEYFVELLLELTQYFCVLFRRKCKSQAKIKVEYKSSLWAKSKKKRQGKEIKSRQGTRLNQDKAKKLYQDKAQG